MIHTVLAFLILISILIVFHEFGHFIVAKLFGVKVEVFSVGFGNPIFKKQIGETLYQIAYIPMGGYVKLYGEEENINDPRAFTSKPAWQKILIAAAGPFFNLLIAFVGFTLAFMIGIQQFAYMEKPVKIGYIEKTSPLYKAGLKPGDEIVKINNTPIKNWRDLLVGELKAVGSTATVYYIRDNKLYEAPIKIGKILNKDAFEIYPDIKPVVGGAIKGTPAYQIGLQKGDKILSINNIPVKSWYDISDIIKNDKGAMLNITFQRDGNIYTKSLIPAYSKKLKEYYIGIYPEQKTILERYSLGQAMLKSIDKIKSLALLSVDSIKALVSLHASILNLSGPISIAKMSGQAAQGGISDFLAFMSFVSLQLAIINILPIPMLDGGLIVLFLIEAIIRRPLSETFKDYWQKVGIAFVVSLSAVAILSDIIRLFTGV